MASLGPSSTSELPDIQLFRKILRDCKSWLGSRDRNILPLLAIKQGNELHVPWSIDFSKPLDLPSTDRLRKKAPGINSSPLWS
jgi:hypothetical protein